MKNSRALILSGAGIGFFLGSSMGIAAGGTAFNAVWLFTPLGAFIGWLLSTRGNAISASNAHEDDTIATGIQSVEDSKSERDGLQSIIHSALAILASVWNFQIDLLKTLGLLNTFVRQPLLFVALCIVVSIFLPPFLVVYFLAWLAASHFGISAESEYRANVR